jgi:hypothetical protein
MSIQNHELKWYRSLIVSNTSANGGRLSTNQIVTGVRNNVFPDVSEAERVAGITRYRKLFLKVANTDNEMLANCMIHLLSITPADDYVTMFEGTQVNVQGDISSPTEFGAGVLAASVNAGDSSFDVNIENTGMVIFHNTDTIFITDGTNEEYQANVTVSKNGTVYTITLEAGAQLANSYASGSVVASCIDIGDVDYSIDDFVDTSVDGTYSETDNITVDNIGGIYETWTLIFTSATAFNCAGSFSGAIGSGSRNSDYSPTNPNFSRPYFTLKSAGFGGTWAEGDTIVFTTVPRAVPIWFKKVVPAAAAAYSGNSFDFRVIGETA